MKQEPKIRFKPSYKLYCERSVFIVLNFPIRSSKKKKGDEGVKAELIVASDTHGQSYLLDELCEAYPKADLFLHCGDLEDDATKYPKWLFVRGNNDWDSSMPEGRIVTVAGIRIYIVHSQYFSYGRREEQLAQMALKNDCQLVLYGHTHVAKINRIKDVVLINPGSMCLPRDGQPPCYAKVLIMNDGSIKATLIHQPDWPFMVQMPKHFWF